MIIYVQDQKFFIVGLIMRGLFIFSAWDERVCSYGKFSHLLSFLFKFKICVTTFIIRVHWESLLYIFMQLYDMICIRRNFVLFSGKSWWCWANLIPKTNSLVLKDKLVVFEIAQKWSKINAYIKLKTLDWINLNWNVVWAPCPSLSAVMWYNPGEAWYQLVRTSSSNSKDL